MAITQSGAHREVFSGRTSFIFAAVGSAIGLGNIWRFPYIAYTNGGGAFIIPYLVALLTAGIPLLFFFYALGHRYRGSAPLVFRRVHPGAEFIGWWQVAVAFVISVYYAVVIAWALAYTIFSVNLIWGKDPADFFLHHFLESSAAITVGFHVVPTVLIPLVIVWVGCIVTLAFGVQRGIAGTSILFIPLLFVMFLILVVRSLMLPGAAQGLDALFTPDWSKLTDSSIWIAAYGQIFFSLSVGFGIMLTYASYLKPKSNLTSNGLFVGFANSAFELLAGIGVFAALGFLASQTGKPVSEVAQSGVGLAFIGFPVILSKAPLGNVLGVLFFMSLVFAGFTSIISLLEVIVSAVRDKLGLTRLKATLLTSIPMAIISIALFSTTTGLNLLDVTDRFVNNFGIVPVALVAIIGVAICFSGLPILRNHLNAVSSFKVGRGWQLLVAGVTPIVLGYTLIGSVQETVTKGYNDIPTWFINTFGWGMAIALIVVALLVAKIPWSARSALRQQGTPEMPIGEPLFDRHLDARHLLQESEEGENE